jgi:hypothetical protein
MQEGFIDSVIERWRGATMSHKKLDDSMHSMDSLTRDEFSPVTTAPRLDPDRFKILKKQVEGLSDGLLTKDPLTSSGRWPR